MLVGQRVEDVLDLGDNIQDVFGHVVHGSLDGGAVLGSEAAERDFTGGLPGLAELVAHGLDSSEAGEGLPLPSSVDVGGQDTVPGLGERGVLVADEVVEAGTGALEDGQVLDAALDGDAFLAGDAGAGEAGLVAVLDEAVRVRLAVELDAVPAVRRDVNVGDVDVRVLLDKVVAESRGELLGRVDGVLLGEQEDGVLHRVRSYDDAVVGLRVRSLDVALKQTAHGHLGHGVHARLGVAVRLEDADIVLAVARSGY